MAEAGVDGVAEAQLRNPAKNLARVQLLQARPPLVVEVNEASSRFGRMTVWPAVKRPLFVAFLLGCTVSLMTARLLTLRILVSAMVYWSAVPLIEIAALAVVCRRDRHETPFPHLIDAFFKGFTPWLLWLVGVSAIGSFLAPAAEAADWTVSMVWLVGGGALALVWSLAIDFSFFRSVLRRSRPLAMRDLALHRCISWPLTLALIGAPTIWSTMTGRLW